MIHKAASAESFASCTLLCWGGHLHAALLSTCDWRRLMVSWNLAAGVWTGGQHPTVSSVSCYLRLERGLFKFMLIGWLQMSMRSHQGFWMYGLSSCAMVIHSIIPEFRAWQRFYINRKGFFSIMLKLLWTTSDISTPSVIEGQGKEMMLGYLAICVCGNIVVQG